MGSSHFEFSLAPPMRLEIIRLVGPFPSGIGTANFHYPALRVGIPTAIKIRIAFALTCIEDKTF
jgi:hypothetical protein